MSYDYLERSNHDGMPVALYEILIGGLVWRYNSLNVEVIANGLKYEPLTISDDGYTQSGDINNDTFEITLPANAPIVQIFQGTPPSQRARVYLRRMHIGDTEAPIHWVGMIMSVRITEPGTAVIVCQPMTGTFNRNGLRLAFGRNCPHALYDNQCKVNRANFNTTVRVDALSGDSFISSQLAQYVVDGWASGGYLTWTRSGINLLESRPIELHTNSTVRLMGTTDGMSVGMYVTVYAGCNRSTAHCAGKFGNLPNFGGFPYLPGKSPFVGNPVF